MHGLQSSEDIQFVIGKELTQVCLGSHQVILNFAQNLTITIECDILFGQSYKKSNQISSDNPLETKELAILLGTEIKNVENKGDGIIILFFSNGYSLVLQDSNKGYESYQLTAEGKSIIV